MTIEDERIAFFAKATENIASARSEYINGRYNACANRAYYAVFHAAIVALLAAGLPAPTGEWGHGYVQARFAGQLITRRKVYPASLRDTLTALLAVREKADYDMAFVSQREASRVVRQAEAFVDAVVTRGGDPR